MNAPEAKAWWSAAKRRDASFDGVFVFAVSTTGIYCRPSCPARRPLAKNVSFFAAPAAAEREGFRACRRCRPGSDLAARACRWLRERLEGRIRLQDLACELGVRPRRLNAEFRRALGIRPAQYVRELRFERFRRASRDGVTPALHGAGFGSASRLYERSSSRLGMTPATAARGGKDMSIAYDIVDSPIGRALIAATPLGICAVFFGDSDRALAKDLSRQFPKAEIRRDARLLRGAREHLRRIFSGAAAGPALPLDVRATAFQARVWDELRAIPAGTTRTYAEIARRLGRPKAARAVGRACASNPVSLLIPCHRAVGADGSLTGYRWGTSRKRALLDRERAAAARP